MPIGLTNSVKPAFASTNSQRTLAPAGSASVNEYRPVLIRLTFVDGTGSLNLYDRTYAVEKFLRRITRISVVVKMISNSCMLFRPAGEISQTLLLPVSADQQFPFWKLCRR